MKNKLGMILPALLSIATIVFGVGFFVTFISVHLKNAGHSDSLIGLMQAAYSAGLLIGAFATERLIRALGHIRAFASGASFMAVTILVMGLDDSTSLWLAMRFLAGLAMAVQYVAIESWLLCSGEPHMRGRILAYYMIGFYVSQAFGQFVIDFVDLDSAQPFMIASMFATLAVIPFSLTQYHAAILPDVSTHRWVEMVKRSPYGIAGCFCSGMILASIYGFTPIYALFHGQPISWIMFVTIGGGVLLQWPMGKLSDIFHRCNVLIFLSALLLVPCIFLLLYPDELFIALASSFLMGGVAFTLYPVSIAEVSDHFESKDITNVTAVLLGLYGLGAVVGPVLGPLLFPPMEETGLYLYMASIGVFLVLFGFIARHRERRRIVREREFSALPRITPLLDE